MSSITFKQIKIQNFLSFTKEVILPLDKQGTICVEGVVKDNTGNTSNGSGKSTLAIESLYWALTGETLRGLKGDDVINKFSKKDTAVIVTILDGDTEYQIRRYRGHKVHKNELSLFVAKDSRFVDITKATTSDTQEYIYEILGSTKDVLRYTVFSSPNLIESFSTKTDMQQKALLENVLSIIDTSAALDQVKVSVGTLNNEILKYNNTVSGLTQTIELYKTSIEGYLVQDTLYNERVAKDTADLQTQITEAETQIAAKDLELAELIGTQQILEALVKDVEIEIQEYREAGKDTKEQVTKHDMQLYTTGQLLTTKQTQLIQLEIKQNTYIELFKSQNVTMEHHKQIAATFDKTDPIKTIQGMIPKQAELVQKLTYENLERKPQERHLLDAIAKVQKTIEACQSVSEGVVCEHCGNLITLDSKRGLIDTHVLEHRALNKELLELQEAYSVTAENIRIAKQKQEQLETVVGLCIQIQEYENIMVEIDDVKKAIALLEEQHNVVQKLRDEKQLAVESIQAIEKAKVASIAQHQEDIRMLNQAILGLQTDLAGITADLKNAKGQLVIIENSVSAYVTLIEQTGKDIKIKEGEIESLNSLVQEKELTLKHYKFWEVGFSNKGIKSYIFDLYTPLLNEYTSHYLSILTKGTVSVTFSTQTTLKSGEVREKFSIDIDNEFGSSTYEGSSRGQRQRIDLAITLALYKIAQARSSKKIKYLALDEIDDGVDDAGIEQIIEIINELSTEVETLFVLSHKSAMKAYFDKVLTVVYENKQSRILIP